MCFPVNFAKFLRTPFLQNTSGRLILHFLDLKFPLLKYQKRKGRQMILKIEFILQINEQSLES